MRRGPWRTHDANLPAISSERCESPCNLIGEMRISLQTNLLGEMRIEMCIERPLCDSAGGDGQAAKMARPEGERVGDFPAIPLPPSPSPSLIPLFIATICAASHSWLGLGKIRVGLRPGLGLGFVSGCFFCGGAWLGLELGRGSLGLGV